MAKKNGSFTYNYRGHRANFSYNGLSVDLSVIDLSDGYDYGILLTLDCRDVSKDDLILEAQELIDDLVED